MHGSIFVFLKRFVEYQHNYNTWVDILEREGLQSRTQQGLSPSVPRFL